MLLNKVGLEDLMDTKTVNNLVNEKQPVGEAISPMDFKVILSSLMNEEYNIITFTQTQSIGNGIPCIGILLEKRGPILSVAYPYIIIYDDTNVDFREDRCLIYPYNGLDFTSFTGNAEADGILYMNADKLNAGYMLFNYKSAHTHIQQYKHELNGINNYLDSLGNGFNHVNVNIN